MDLTFAVVLAIVAAMPVVVWIVWWLLADLGQRATGSYSAVHYTTPPRRRVA